MINRRTFIAAVVTAVTAPLLGCSGDKMPADTSEAEYAVGCEALDLFDKALADNDLFGDDLKAKLKTLCVKARDANDHSCSNDQLIMSSLQLATVDINLSKGDDALDAIEQLRSALGKAKS